MSESWRKETFRKSVENKINETINQCNRHLNYGSKIEQAIFEKSNTKQEYLGYITRIILDIRHMVMVNDIWLNSQLEKVLNQRPIRLRRVLPPTELAKYNIDIMKINKNIKDISK